MVVQIALLEGIVEAKNIIAQIKKVLITRCCLIVPTEQTGQAKRHIFNFFAFLVAVKMFTNKFLSFIMVEVFEMNDKFHLMVENVPICNSSDFSKKSVVEISYKLMKSMKTD